MADESKITGIFVLAVLVSCFGNSFLYGWNIGVINQPADIIQEFYNKTYYERQGGVWANMERYNEYLLEQNTSDEEAVLKYFGNASIESTYNILADNESCDHNCSLPWKRLPDSLFGADVSLLMEDKIIKFLWSFTVASFILFGLFGAIISNTVADHFGRKNGMILITFIIFLGATLGGISLAVKSPECLIISRMLFGLHSGMNITLCPLYLAEIAPRKIRGSVGTFNQLFITIGILMSQIFGLKELLNTEKLWMYLFALNALPSLICLVLMPFCPESPRYLLIKRGDVRAAEKALLKFRGTDVTLREEIEEMEQEASRSLKVKHYSIKRLLTTPQLRKPVFIACSLQIFTQWSGINAVFAYSTMMFKLVNVAEDQIPYFVVGTGTINVIVTIFAVPLVEKAGRRPLLLFATVMMLLSFVAMVILLNLQDDPNFAENKTVFAYVCIVAMHTYIIGFAIGFGPVPFLVVGELFRQEPRAAAYGLSLACNWLCAYILVLTFPFLKDWLEEFVYLIFIAVLFVALFFVFFLVPETKNRSFNEIASEIALGRREAAKMREASWKNEELVVEAEECEQML